MAMTVTKLPRYDIAFALNPVEYYIECDAADLDHFEITLTAEPEWYSGNYVGVFNWIENYMIDADGNKYARIDISELLLSRVQPLLPTTDGDFDVLDPISRYSIHIEAKDAAGTDVETDYDDEDCVVVYGGVQQQKWNNYSEFYFLWQTGFASWRPTGSKIRNDQPFTWYFQPSLAHQYRYKMKKYPDSGSATTVTIDTITVTEPYRMYGPVEPLPVGDDIYKIELWVEDVTASTESDHITLYIDRTFRRNVKFFSFNNSLGGWDDIYCTGQYVEEYEYAGDSQNVIPVQTLNDFDLPASEKTIYREEQNVFTASTGWKTKAEIDWMREAMLALNVYEYNETDGWIPIAIISDTMRTLMSDDQMYAMQFKYSYQFKNKAYTPKEWVKLQ